MSNTISAAINDVVLTAAVIITETNSRDTRFFDAFRNRLLRTVQDKFAQKYPSWIIKHISFHGKVQWYSASKSKQFWVMSLGNITLDVENTIEKEHKYSIDTGIINLFFDEGNRGYILNKFTVANSGFTWKNTIANGAQLTSLLVSAVTQCMPKDFFEVNKGIEKLKYMRDNSHLLFPMLYGEIGMRRKASQILTGLGVSNKAIRGEGPSETFAYFVQDGLESIELKDNGTFKQLRGDLSSKYPVAIAVAAGSTYSFESKADVLECAAHGLAHWMSFGSLQYDVSLTGYGYIDGSSKLIYDSKGKVLGKISDDGYFQTPS